jgi:hypothetical protein
MEDMMRTTMAALAAGLLLASAPAFAAGDHNRINSAARTPEGVKTPDAANAEDTTTRTARTQTDNSLNQNQTQNENAGEATPASPDAGVTPQSDNGRANGPNAPAQAY